MVEITIDVAKCTGCGECISACKNRALGIVDGMCVVVDRSRCKLCMLCIAYCPVKAKSVLS
ncbi:MAG: 4Fe-4S binding protein [Methanosarcinales archaeon]|nr:4Fe-4S binding protein [Methanosarcinales archaeon]